MAGGSRRGKYRRKLGQCSTQLDRVREYLAEVGAAYDEAKPVISKGCEAAYQIIDCLDDHIKRMVTEL